MLGALRLEQQSSNKSTSALLVDLRGGKTEILCKTNECLHSQFVEAKIHGKIGSPIFTEVLQW